MRVVIPHLLWIGNARDARSVAGLLEVGIGAVVDLAMEEPPIVLPRELIYARFPLIDGEGNGLTLIRTATAVVQQLVAGGIPTLVACSGGMSRSPAIAAASLAKMQGISLEAALDLITKNQPHDISPALWHRIESVFVAGSN